MFVLSFVIVRGRLNEEIFMRIIATIKPVVTEGWEIVIENPIAIVLGDASQLNYTVHLIFRVW